MTPFTYTTPFAYLPTSKQVSPVLSNYKKRFLNFIYMQLFWLIIIIRKKRIEKIDTLSMSSLKAICV